MVWFLKKYYPFKNEIIEKFEVQKIHPLNISGWHHGIYYFRAARKGRDCFIKTDFYLGLLKNEIAASNILLADVSHKKYFVSPEFYDTTSFKYIAFQYFEGVNIKDYVLNGNASFSEKITTVNKIFPILDCLYKNSIVHRDIKETDILVSPEGNLVLVDFGFAVSTVQKNGFYELDVSVENNRKILGGMGVDSQPKSLHWDDAYGVYQLLKKIDGKAMVDLSSCIAEAKKRISRISYCINSGII